MLRIKVSLKVPQMRIFKILTERMITICVNIIKKGCTLSGKYDKSICTFAC